MYGGRTTLLLGCLSVRLPACLSVCFSACLPFCLSIALLTPHFPAGCLLRKKDDLNRCLEFVFMSVRHTHTLTHARARTHTHTHTHTHTQTHTLLHTDTHTQTHARTHAHTRTLTRTLTRAHTHIHTHIHTHCTVNVCLRLIDFSGFSLSLAASTLDRPGSEEYIHELIGNRVSNFKSRTFVEKKIMD